MQPEIKTDDEAENLYHVPWSRLSRFSGDKLIPPLMTESLFHGYINPYYWVDDHPLLYGNNESLDPGHMRNGWKSPSNHFSFVDV